MRRFGGVGTGKTMLMDMFYDCIDFTQKKYASLSLLQKGGGAQSEAGSGCSSHVGELCTLLLSRVCE